MSDGTVDRGLERTAELFRSLANPVRVALVRELADGPRDVTSLVDALAVPQPRISDHLAILRAANLVAGERQGRHIYYRLVDEHVAHIVADALLHATEPAGAPM